MKKIIKLVLGILLIFIILEIIFYIFKNTHDINYEIKANDKKYQINEIYKNDKYYFKINYKNEIYSFEINNNFNKRKHVIKEIYSYQNNDLYCIYPVLKNDKYKTNILCSKNKQAYSYEYFKKDLTSFVEMLKDKGYSIETSSKNSKKIGTLTAYQDNIEKNTYIYIYKYNGFYTINKDNLEKLDLFKNDTYVNNLGTQVDKYYVIPNYNQNYDYDEFYRIDMTNNKIKTIKLKKQISKDSYINGIIDNKIYIFDKDELVQYTINPKNKKQKEVGNKKDGVLTYDLKFKNIDVYTMRDEEIKFNTIDNYIEKLEGTTDIKYITKTEDSYYYQDKNNNLYYYNLNSKIKVLLLTKEIGDLKLINDTLYFISGKDLYSYQIEKGLKKILTYDELDFNTANRMAIYME